MAYLLEGREAVRLARVHGARAELLLDAQQLVVPAARWRHVSVARGQAGRSVLGRIST